MMIARRDAIAGPGREKGQAQLNDRGSSRCADSVLASALSQLATLPGYCLDFLVETIVADWLVLIERHAQVGARGVIQCGAKQIAIRFTSWSLVRREGQLGGDVVRGLHSLAQARSPGNSTKGNRRGPTPCPRAPG